MPVSVSTVVFDGYAMDLCFEMLADLGFTLVEPAFIAGYVAFDETAFTPAEATRMARRLADFGLRAQAISAHIDLGLPDSATRLERRAEFAAGVGAPILITNATSVERQGRFLATLDAVLPRIGNLGLMLALENPGHGTGALLDCGISGARVLAAFPDPALRLNYDVGNAMTYGACRTDALADLQAAAPVVAHVHLKDVIEDEAGWHFCPVGDGIVGIAAVLDWLARTHPDLPLGLELPLRLFRPGFADPVRRPHPPSLDEIRQALRRSSDFLRDHAISI